MNSSYKFYLKVVSVTLLLGISNVSWAVDVQGSPSSFLSESLAKMIPAFADEKTYDELKQQLWKEYLSYSEHHAEKFVEAAKQNKVSLKNYMCLSVNPSESASESVKRLQEFQQKTATDFDLKNERDSQEIAKLQELQATYKEICEATEDGMALNSKASVVIAETTFYGLYMSAHDQLIAFLNLKN